MGACQEHGDDDDEGHEGQDQRELDHPLAVFSAKPVQHPTW